MDARTWQRAKEWLLDAAALPEPERGAFLAARCPDEGLRRELLEMLMSDGTLSSIVNAPAFAPGTRLGPYEIDAVIGAGGMGEVYRARDVRLGRTVAIKVLPAAFANDRDRLARFEREAKLLAALNHPHICTLFDVGRESDTDYIVMECVDGELLTDRLRHGPLPVDKALAYAIEIADALDKAHTFGIVHRDLKPGNVMLTKSGTKLLDFGLARDTRAPVRDVTKTGTVLGTLRYMSPEQLKGADADARSDVWAFGCVLYQMLAGRPPFDSESEAAIGAAILEAAPAPLPSSARAVSPSLQRVLDRCLAKAPDDRWQSLADLRYELEWIARSRSLPAGAPRSEPTVPTRREWIAWGLALVLLGTTIALGVRGSRPSPAAPPEALQFTIDTPGIIGNPGFPTLSPDGRQLAYVARDRDDATPIVWVRSMDTGVTRPLAGTPVERPHLFWSPDARAIGFFADGKLKRVDVATGATRVICDAASGRGGTWSADGTIVFAPAGYSPLLKVAAGGGAPTPVTDAAVGSSHRFPSFLADGRHFLFTDLESNGWSSIRIGSIDARSTTELVRLPAETGVFDDLSQAYISGEWLLSARQRSLYARRFDQVHQRLVGDDIVIAKDIDSDANGRSAFTVAQGILVYRMRVAVPRQLTWSSRDGANEGTLWMPAQIDTLSLSPDGGRAVIGESRFGSTGALWVVDLQRNVASRLSTVVAVRPLWSRNGARIFFAKAVGLSLREIHAIAADGSGGDELVTANPDGAKWPVGWTDIGSLLMVVASGRDSSALWEVPLGGGAPVLRSAGDLNTNFTSVSVSPDGRLASYVARDGLYVQKIAGGDRVLAASDALPVAEWRGDGRELYYLTNGHLMAVDVSDGARLQVGTPRRLFDFDGTVFTPSADGRRFLLAVPTGRMNTRLTAVVNWPSRLVD